MTEPIAMVPIGVARTPFDAKGDAPRQPRAAEGVEGRIELFEGHHFEDALEGIEEWDHLWVIFVFDRANGWRPKVQPPRSPRKRGLFGTRAPRRPNPIGMSVVRLRSVEGLTLHISDVDLLDGTPILDIKPYVPWCDAIPDASQGWLERPDDPGDRWAIRFEALAEEQLAFLAEADIDLRDRIADHLSLGPYPHAYRRIKKSGDGYLLKVTDWRAHFVIEGEQVRVQRLASGYKRKDRPPLHERFTATFEPPTESV
ncbi:MAG: tRNA (N6-threonylcarbamoyladenosine(37)-N6)-methyltransferase TrmO [Deltaproteobacteria bacterium]|nr:tRNA (N6-threonylcarbamoyladenosine(37)-N6)-methyltransferase TrmO [Deltaproteobacteria bacterium]